MCSNVKRYSKGTVGTVWVQWERKREEEEEDKEKEAGHSWERGTLRRRREEGEEEEEGVSNKRPGNQRIN